MELVFKNISLNINGTPQVIIAKTIKGKGVSFIEGHGKWHHRIPNEIEFKNILDELSQ